MAKPAPRAMTDKQRASARQKIQVARKQLGLADEAYYGILQRVGGVASSTKLDDAGIDAVLAEMVRLGFQPTRPARAGRKPHGGADKAALLGKIDALLAEAGKSINYANGIARHMFKVDAVSFCEPWHLHKIVAALEYQAKRTKQ